MVIFRIRSEFSAEFSKDTVKFTIILRATWCQQSKWRTVLSRQSLLSNSYHGSRTFNPSWYFTTLKKKHANDGVSSRGMLSISSSIHCPITQTLSKQPLIRNICLVAQRHDTLTRQVWVQGKCLITILEDAAVKKFSKATKTSSVYVPCSLPFNRDPKYFCN